jgi:hypothetical protein
MSSAERIPAAANHSAQRPTSPGFLTSRPANGGHWSRRWSDVGISFVSSIVVHLLLVLILAMMFVAIPAQRRELAIDAALHSEPAGNGETPLGTVPFEVPAMNAVGAPNLSDAAVGAATNAVGNDSPSGLGSGGSAVVLAGVDVGVAGGTGNGKGGPKAGFFGTKEAGATFVFVVDGSGSMRGERFQRALAELRKSIKELKSWQKFCVIFYNDIPVPLFHPDATAKLYPSTSAQRVKANKWMLQLAPGGGTEPVEALKQALELQPDVVFFLTDGNIPPETREATKRANRYNTIVHTVGFESRDGEGILKEIAKDNGGRYRYVP